MERALLEGLFLGPSMRDRGREKRDDERVRARELWKRKILQKTFLSIHYSSKLRSKSN